MLVIDLAAAGGAIDQLLEVGFAGRSKMPVAMPKSRPIPITNGRLGSRPMRIEAAILSGFCANISMTSTASRLSSAAGYAPGT